MTSKQALKRVRELINQQEYATALQTCSTALQDKDNQGQYSLWVFQGLCYHRLGDPERGVTSYRHAIAVDEAQLPAWQGLRDIYLESANIPSIVETVQRLASLQDAASRHAQFRKALPVLLADEQRRMAAASFPMKVGEQVAKLRTQRAHSQRLQDGQSPEWPSALDSIVGYDLMAAEVYSSCPEISEWLVELLRAEAGEAALPFRAALLRRWLPLRTWVRRQPSVGWMAGLAVEVPAVLAALAEEIARCEELPEDVLWTPLLALCLSHAAGATAVQLSSKLANHDRCPGEIATILRLADTICTAHTARLTPASGAPPLEGGAEWTVERAIAACGVEDVMSAGTVRDTALDGIAQELVEAVANAPYCLPAWVLLAALQFRLGWLSLAREATSSGLLHLRFVVQQYGALTPAGHTAWEARLLRLRALSCLALRELPRARRAVEQLEGLPQDLGAPDSRPPLLLLRVQLSLAEGQPTEALNLLEGCPARPQPQYWAARANLLAGNAPAALAAVQRAVAECPAHGAANLLAAQCLLGSAEPNRPAALRHLLAAAKAEPDRAEAFAWLGHFYFAEVFPAGHASGVTDATRAAVQRAVKCYERAVRLDPTVAVSGRQLVRLYTASQRPDLILDVCRQLADPRVPSPVGWAHTYLAAEELRAGNPEEALRLLRVAAGSPEPADVPGTVPEPYSAQQCYDIPLGHLTLGRAHAALGQGPPALGAYRHALRALAAAPVGDAAAEAQRRALRIACHHGIARVHLELGEHAAALQVLQHLADDCPDFVLGWSTKAETLLQMARLASGTDGLHGQACEHLQDAEKSIRWAIRLSPEQPAFHTLLGDICAAAVATPGWEDTAAAYQTGQEAYNAALQRGGPPSAGHYALGLLHQAYWQSGLGADAEEEARRRAEAAFRAALLAHPADPAVPLADLWLALGCSLPARHPARRQHCFLRALEADRKKHAAWVALGFLYLQHERVPAAQAAFRRAQALCPSSLRAWLGHAWCLPAASGGPPPLLTAAQRQAFLHVATLGRDDTALAYAVLAGLLAPEGVSPAVKGLLGQLGPSLEPFCLNALGCYYELQGQPVLALRCLEAAARASAEWASSDRASPRAAHRAAILANLLRVWCRTAEPPGADMRDWYAEWAAAAPTSAPAAPDPQHTRLRLACHLRGLGPTATPAPPPLDEPDAELQDLHLRHQAALASAGRVPLDALRPLLASPAAAVRERCAAAWLALDALQGGAAAADLAHAATAALVRSTSPAAHTLLGTLRYLLGHGRHALEHLHHGLAQAEAADGGLQRDFGCAYSQLVAHLAPDLAAGTVTCHPDIHPATVVQASEGDAVALPPLQRVALALHRAAATDPSAGWALACSLYAMGTAKPPLLEALALHRIHQLDDEVVPTESETEEGQEGEAGEEEESDTADGDLSEEPEAAAPKLELTLSSGGCVPLTTVQETMFACQRLLQHDPGCQKAWRLLGLALASSAQLKGLEPEAPPSPSHSDAAAAVRLLRRYLANNSVPAYGDVPVQWAILKCLVLQRRWAAATEDIEAWLATKPGDDTLAGLYVTLARVRWLARPEDDGWHSALATALDLLPSPAVLAEAVALLQHAGRAEEALAVLEAQADGTSLATQLQGALLWLSRGQPATAREQLASAAAQHPHCGTCAVLEAHCREQLGDQPEPERPIGDPHLPLWHGIQARLAAGQPGLAYDHLRWDLPFSRSYGYEATAMLACVSFAMDHYPALLQERVEKASKPPPPGAWRARRGLAAAPSPVAVAEAWRAEARALLRRAARLRAADAPGAPPLARWAALLAQPLRPGPAVA